MRQAAKAAQAIRKELKSKFPEIKFSVTSQTYSGGDNVNILYSNAIPTEEVEKITRKYQDGDFDGMIDLYLYKSNPENLPRAKYVFVRREIDDEIKQSVKNEIARKFGIKNINDEKEWHKIFNSWSDQVVWRELREMTF